jgi:polysaccharide biosynthesis protein PslG
MCACVIPARERTLQLVLVVAMTMALVPSAQARVPGDFFGVNGELLLGGPAVPALATIGAGGLQVLRVGIERAYVERRGQLEWFGYDDIATTAASAGVRLYPYLGFTAHVSGDTHAAPHDIAAFAAYAAAVARRYGRGGSFWREHPELPRLPVTSYEVWNEENAAVFWHPQRRAPEIYADLYLATQAAIKRVDPRADVVVGGLALRRRGTTTDEVRFVERMFAHRPSLRRKVDAVGLHPYQRRLADVYARIARFRRGLDLAAGRHVPIEITEIGWASNLVPERERARDLAALATQLPRSDCGIRRLIPFTWLTWGIDRNNPEDWFGIAKYDGSTPMLSGRDYLNAVRTMRGLSSTPAPTGRVRICGR